MKKKHGHKELLKEDNPVLRVLTSAITYFITEKKTLTSVNLTVAIHGMTRRKELIDISHRCGYALVTTISSFCTPFGLCEILRLEKPILVAELMENLQ